MDMKNDFLEKTLEDIIFENKDVISERGFPSLYKNTERQYQINSKRIDLFSYEEVDNVFYFKIFELKRDVVHPDAFHQIADYFWQIGVSLKDKGYTDCKYELYLIGNDFHSDLFNYCFISEFLHLYQYKYDYDGIKFEKMGRTIAECKNFFLHNGKTF